MSWCILFYFHFFNFLIFSLIYLSISCCILFLFLVFSGNDFRAKSQIRFLSRRCFTLCIYQQWKLNLQLRSCTKWHNSSFCKNYRGKVDGGWKRCLHSFSLDQKIASVWPEWFVHPTARATSCYLLPNTLWLRAFKNVSKVCTVGFANSQSPPSDVKKVGLLTGIKSSQGT